MPAGRTVGKPLAALLVVLALAAGCTVVRGTITTFRALGDAGFSSPQLNSGDGSVDVHVRRDAEDLNAAARQAAEIVWRNLPLRIDRLGVVCENKFGGRGTFDASRRELEVAFGPRDPDLDKPVKKSELRNIGLIALGVVGFGFLVLVAGVIVIVVLVRRSKRRSAAPPGYPPGPA